MMILGMVNRKTFQKLKFTKPEPIFEKKHFEKKTMLKERCWILSQHFSKGDFPSDNLPSGNFPKEQFTKRQLPKG